MRGRRLRAARPRAAAAPSRASPGSCDAKRGSGRAGASGAGPRRKKRSRAPSSRSASHAGALLRAAVLGEPARQLLGRLLGLELGELGLLVGEERARLQLEQRRDQDEELAARVEVELVALGEVLDEREHDLGEIDLAQRQLVAEDERQQEVERPLERVEVELELADEGRRHRRRRLAVAPDAALRDGHLRRASASVAAAS